jgi:hypothetical protein
MPGASCPAMACGWRRLAPSNTCRADRTWLAAAAYASNRHHPQPGMHCSWCQYRTVKTASAKNLAKRPGKLLSRLMKNAVKTQESAVCRRGLRIFITQTPSTEASTKAETLHSPPFPRRPVRLNGSYEGLPQKANSWQPRCRHDPLRTSTAMELWRDLNTSLPTTQPEFHTAMARSKSSNIIRQKNGLLSYLH